MPEVVRTQNEPAPEDRRHFDRMMELMEGATLMIFDTSENRISSNCGELIVKEGEYYQTREGICYFIHQGARWCIVHPAGVMRIPTTAEADIFIDSLEEAKQLGNARLPEARVTRLQDLLEVTASNKVRIDTSKNLRVTGPAVFLTKGDSANIPGAWMFHLCQEGGANTDVHVFADANTHGLDPWDVDTIIKALEEAVVRGDYQCLEPSESKKEADEMAATLGRLARKFNQEPSEKKAG